VLFQHQECERTPPPPRPIRDQQVDCGGPSTQQSAIAVLRIPPGLHWIPSSQLRSIPKSRMCSTGRKLDFSLPRHARTSALPSARFDHGRAKESRLPFYLSHVTPDRRSVNCSPSETRPTHPPLFAACRQDLRSSPDTGSRLASIACPFPPTSCHGSFSPRSKFLFYPPLLSDLLGLTTRSRSG